MPFYDDITQILWILNEFIDPKLDSQFVTLANTPDKIHALFYPNAGHIPLGTRLFTLLQYYTGGVNFKTSMIAANFGWVATCLLFMAWCWREAGIRLLYILPIPFLMMTITHWEAMSMTLGAWQMYWGAALFPVATLLALTSGNILLASALFFGALFESGGSLCLYPLCVAYLLINKNWKGAAIFSAIAGLQVWLFLHFNPLSNNVQMEIPPLLLITKYVLGFTGNMFSAGSYNLGSLATLQMTTGATILLAGIYCIITVKGMNFTKLLFVYVILLAGMAVYKRSDMWVVSRYSMFSLLAACSVYSMMISKGLKNSPRIASVCASIFFLFVLGLWGSSLKYCTVPLQADHASRIASLQQFISNRDASGLMWNGPWASEILSESKRLNVYDYMVGKEMIP